MKKFVLLLLVICSCNFTPRNTPSLFATQPYTVVCNQDCMEPRKWDSVRILRINPLIFSTKDSIFILYPTTIVSRKL